MSTEPLTKPAVERKRKKNVINRLVENPLIGKVSYETYRDKVRDVYDGPQGALLATASLLSLHLAFGERLFRKRRFELTGVKKILDVGSGAGQIAKHLLKYADRDAQITCCDLSVEMLRRSRVRLKSNRPKYSAADVTRLPFADNSFDCVTCGYVLEHLPDARLGLSELARVLVPGGRLLLLTTEDSFGGAWTSRVWYCRTYSRHEILDTCRQVGLDVHRELWFSRMHKLLRAGGICLDLRKRA
ncbi:MAG: methyltransferase domain-containing protein [Planctomycetaceae bacterium]|nr:methyltransferase domain-containing protein [Planctomycetaceae bacterium]